MLPNVCGCHMFVAHHFVLLSNYVRGAPWPGSPLRLLVSCSLPLLPVLDRCTALLLLSCPEGESASGPSPLSSPLLLVLSSSCRLSSTCSSTMTPAWACSAWLAIPCSLCSFFWALAAAAAAVSPAQQQLWQLEFGTAAAACGRSLSRLLPLGPCLAPDPDFVCSDLELHDVEARLRPGTISLTLVASASFTLPALWTSCGPGRQNGAGGMLVSY